MRLLCRLGRHKWGAWEYLTRTISVGCYVQPPDRSWWEKRVEEKFFPGQERKCKRCGKSELRLDDWPEITIDPFGYYRQEVS